MMPLGVAADDVQAVTEPVEGLVVHAVASLGRFGAHRLGDP